MMALAGAMAAQHKGGMDAEQFEKALGVAIAEAIEVAAAEFGVDNRAVINHCAIKTLGRMIASLAAIDERLIDPSALSAFADNFCEDLVRHTMRLRGDTPTKKPTIN